jgi:membrane protease YdiL (CAAX protease family)
MAAMSTPSLARLRRQRAAEFALVFLGLPLLLWWQGAILRRWILPQLWLMGLVCLLLLLRDSGFDRRQLRSLPRHLRSCLRRIGLIFLAGGIVAMLAAAHFPEVSLFGFPRRHPLFWLAVLLLYPPVSALPQELIFRVFLFHRYRCLFPTPGLMIAASAGSFALTHLILGNWVAPLLSLVGGLLFAYTYAMSRSLTVVALEHGLWGGWLFTLGLGRYFYGGHF